MSLRLSFNLVLLVALVAGLAVTGFLSWRMLNRHAAEEVVQSAGIMMEAASAIRTYTVDEVRPLIDLDAHEEFIPETVPAFAATEAFATLRDRYPDYSYKEATLNPTNPRDRALDWEADVVQRFRDDEALEELTGRRETADGEALWLARPIRIDDPSCLACHSDPSSAPASLIRTYGDDNGFGWQLGEVVGSQIVSVPMDLAYQDAREAFWLVMISLSVIFAVLFVALNLLLGLIVVRPITQIAGSADEISLGKLDAPEFDEAGAAEIATLKASFNRMRRSLERAMEMLRE